MLHERIYLDKDDERVYIDTYVVNDKSYERDAILVIPGGGYSAICTEREGEPIALAYVAHGLNAFVLHYRVGEVGDVYPKQLIDAGRAIIHIKENAEKYGINPDRVFTVGFSAGGHLSGSCAIMYDRPEVRAALGISGEENKPRASILGYPVVSANVKPTTESTFRRLLGKPYDEITDEERRVTSLETSITERSAPLFIWHTREDIGAPIDGTLLLAQAARRVGIIFTLHIYPYGPHGVALSNKITECGKPTWVQPLAEGWLSDSVEWMKTID